MTPEEKLIVDRLQATYADVDEMQKVFDIVTKTLALREAEIEQLRAANMAFSNEVSLSEREIDRLQFLNTEERKTIEELSRLCIRAADALEVYLPTAAGGTRHPFIDELRKAAE